MPEKLHGVFQPASHYFRVPVSALTCNFNGKLLFDLRETRPCALDTCHTLALNPYQAFTLPMSPWIGFHSEN